ncbi:MAG: cyclic dehypoxanthinyl futalosine synthase [Bacteroidota bacterium]
MNIQSLTQKALQKEDLNIAEGVYLYTHANLAELMFVANVLRSQIRPDNVVTWIIDRNVNITNVCISRCLFCNFHVPVNHPETYITDIHEYSQKISELEQLGGDQLLIQGGMNPKLGLDFYIDLFSKLKAKHPNIKLHALGPPEIVFLARKAHMSYREVLEKLTDAGMESLPGAGAEILSNDIRKKISPGKCSADEWLEVMREAHKMNITTSATMMYGHIESIEDRITHLVKLRELQSEKPENSAGFTAFIPWPFYSKGTKIEQFFPDNYSINHEEYIRMIAISRIMLTNIPNIQASWLTVGLPTAQICLHAGAHDLGSIMIEENVVSQAGAGFRTNKDEIQQAIRNAGFTPRLRNQKYEYGDK